MHFFKHLGNTWLLAHALHPFLFSAVMLVQGGSPADLTLVFICSLLLGALVSVPLLLLFMWPLPQIVALPLPAPVRFAIWCAALCGLLAAYCFVLAWLTEGWPGNFHFLVLGAPALIATLVAALLRQQVFEQGCAAHDQHRHRFADWNELISQPLNTAE